MSKIYLNNLTQIEYDKLAEQLYNNQEGNCFVCGKHIANPHIDTHVTSIKNHHIFKLEDYALCHKDCERSSVTDDILMQAIDNFEYVSGVSLTVELVESKDFDPNMETNYMDDIIELDKQNQKDWEDYEFWENDKQICKALTHYEKAKEHKKQKKYKHAITALEKAISIVQEVNCPIYPEFHSSLIDCYAKTHDTENQIRCLKLAIELYDNPKYTRMLKRINGTEKECILNRESYKVIAKCNYGEIYEKHVKEHLPEFNFYHNNYNPFRHHDFEKNDMLPVIRTIDRHFHLTYNEAGKAEMSEFYNEAVELYEQLIAEGVYTPKAYERLIVLYSKANRTNDVIRVLQTGINYFENRKNKEIEYVRSLAKKYGKEDYCEMCIKTGKKIRYYCGYIILFQEYPFIDKWKKRLSKLTN